MHDVPSRMYRTKSMLSWTVCVLFSVASARCLCTRFAQHCLGRLHADYKDCKADTLSLHRPGCVSIDPKYRLIRVFNGPEFCRCLHWSVTFCSPGQRVIGCDYPIHCEGEQATLEKAKPISEEYIAGENIIALKEDPTTAADMERQKIQKQQKDVHSWVILGLAITTGCLGSISLVIFGLLTHALLQRIRLHRNELENFENFLANQENMEMMEAMQDVAAEIEETDHDWERLAGG